MNVHRHAQEISGLCRSAKPLLGEVVVAAVALDPPKSEAGASKRPYAIRDI